MSSSPPAAGRRRTRESGDMNVPRKRARTDSNEQDGPTMEKIPSIEEGFRLRGGMMPPLTARQGEAAEYRVLPSLSIPPLSQLQMPMAPMAVAPPAGAASQHSSPAEPLLRVRKETHNATERRRRDRIRERMQELKEAVPGCTSGKKIDILTYAIGHIQALTDRYQDLLVRSDAMLRDYLARGGDVDYLGPHAANLPSAEHAVSRLGVPEAGPATAAPADAARGKPPLPPAPSLREDQAKAGRRQRQPRAGV